jgi:uncharacterized protein DUF4863
MDDLNSLLAPVSRLVAALDLADAPAAEAALARQFPPGSEGIRRIEESARSALAAGSICTRGEPGMRFSRVIKPQDDIAGCSIDAVHMTNAAGPAHTHTRGEVCLCFPDSGSPTFERRCATWMVLSPGSRHVPEVKGGSMLILYWWPDGAVAWG